MRCPSKSETGRWEITTPTGGQLPARNRDDIHDAQCDLRCPYHQKNTRIVEYRMWTPVASIRNQLPTSGTYWCLRGILKLAPSNNFPVGTPFTHNDIYYRRQNPRPLNPTHSGTYFALLPHLSQPMSRGYKLQISPRPQRIPKDPLQRDTVVAPPGVRRIRPYSGPTLVFRINQHILGWNIGCSMHRCGAGTLGTRCAGVAGDIVEC